MPRRIFFQETQNAAPKNDCEVIAFWKGGGHENHAAAAPNGVYEGAYEKIYAPLVAWMEQKPSEDIWFYRGVNLLWCFKYLLFIHAHYAFLMHRAMEKSISLSAGDEILVEDSGPSLSEARLSEILEFSDWKEKLVIRREKTSSAAVAPKKSRVILKDWVWPEKISHGNLSRKKTVLFADIFKFENLIRELGPKKICIYSTVKSPRVYARSLAMGAGFYQCAQPAAYRPHPEAPRRMPRTDTPMPGFRLKMEGMDIGGFCASRLRRLVQAHLDAMLTQIDETHRFFQQAPGLKSALLDEDISQQKNIFCQTASQYGVKTHVKAHGALGGKIGFLPLTADSIFMWGNEQAKKIGQWGCEPQKAVVSGCSWLETYRSLDPAKVRKQVLNKFGLDESRPVVVIALHARHVVCFVYEQVIQKTVAWMLDVVSKKKDIQFILKLHHGEADTEYYREWKRRLEDPRRVVITKTHNPYLLALASDAVVSHHSTYALDAFALNKPVICVKDEYLTSCLSEVDRFGVFTDVYDPATFEKALDLMLSHPPQTGERKTVLRECLNIGDGIPGAARFIASRLLPGEVL